MTSLLKWGSEVDLVNYAFFCWHAALHISPINPFLCFNFLCWRTRLASRIVWIQLHFRSLRVPEPMLNHCQSAPVF